MIKPKGCCCIQTALTQSIKSLMKNASEIINPSIGAVNCPNGSRLIPLSKGAFAVVDEEDFNELSKHKWHLNNGYAMRTIRVNGKPSMVLMHREILKTPCGLFTDHVNEDKLDNRKSNLRMCNKPQNMHNRGAQKNNTSGFKGVSFQKNASKYMARIKSNGVDYYLGLFNCPEEAHAAYREASLRLHGEFSKC